MATNDVTDFYITIPSWTSSDYFALNSIGDFRIQLPQPLDLRGIWSVGLSQILYTHTWYNIENNKNQIYITVDGKNFTILVTEGKYKTEQALINQININIKEQIKHTPIKFEYNSQNFKCRITLPANCVLHFCYNLGKLLGFREITISHTTEGVFPINLNYNTQAIFIYCDIIEEQILGKEKWQLLKFMHVQDNKFGECVTQTYDNPQYITLSKKHFETVHIKICNQEKEVIHFQKGVNIIQLHFKLSKIPLFY